MTAIEAMKKILSTLTILLIGIAAGHLISTQLLPKYLPQFAVTGSGESQDGTADANEPLYWVAPMDANYRRDKPGLSPMGMELVPVYAEDLNGDSPGTVKISPEVVNNLGVRSAEVGFGPLTRRVDTVGYVGFDEDQLQHIHSRLPAGFASYMCAAMAAMWKRARRCMSCTRHNWSTPRRSI